MIRFEALRELIKSGEREYPVYMGFLSAGEILRVAEAPSFMVKTAHSTLAANVLGWPIKDWQRPLDGDRVHQIQNVFSNVGEFMPNPVLLSQNPEVKSGVQAKSAIGQGGISLSTFEIEIEDPEEEKPLWILDGQHRIAGLAASAQSDNKVPLVLLINDNPPVYNAAQFAKLFAQVTTTATALNPLHNEWLTFAFELGAYGSGVDSFNHRQAMEAAGRLCERQEYVVGAHSLPNPFWDKVGFNPYELPVGPQNGGFQFTATELKTIVYKEYYKGGTTAPTLSPRDLADEIAKAYVALTKVVKGAPDRTIYFGSQAGGRPVQEAFISGVLIHMAQHGPPPSWEATLKERSFDTTGWDFSSWVGSTGGQEGTISRRASYQILRSLFSDPNPTATGDLSNIFRGDGASVQFIAGYYTAKGAKQQPGRTDLVLTAGAKTLNVDDREVVWFDRRSLTPNIGRLTIYDKKDPFGSVFSTSSMRRGVDLRSLPKNSYQLGVRFEFFGGEKADATLTINRSVGSP